MVDASITSSSLTMVVGSENVPPTARSVDAILLSCVIWFSIQAASLKSRSDSNLLITMTLAFALSRFCFTCTGDSRSMVSIVNLVRLITVSLTLLDARIGIPIADLARSCAVCALTNVVNSKKSRQDFIVGCCVCGVLWGGLLSQGVFCFRVWVCVIQ